VGNRSMVTEAERKILTEQLPHINRIHDDNLRELVIEVWARLWRESPYGDITEVPNFTRELSRGDETLVRHTNAVTKMSEAAAREFQQVYGVTLDYDNLLAGAILHDVDKLVLYERRGDTVELSELGRKVTHGEYGAMVAKQVGLPGQVVNIIASHSVVKRETLPASIEAVLVSSCDGAVFQSYRLMIGEGLWQRP
jgi:putative nucleotidyltransferase with HDIG domain